MRPHLIACILLTLTPALHAQSTEAALRTRLIGQPLYLRTLPSADKLNFDKTGNPAQPSPVLTFTLSGIEVQSLHLSGDKLQIKGRRVGLEFDQDKVLRVPLRIDKLLGHKDEPIEIEVAAPANADYGPALDAIFATDLSQLIPAMPSFWQSYARKHFLAPGEVQSPPDPAPPKSVAPRFQRVGGSVEPPVPIHTPDPSFDQAARSLRHPGTVLVYLRVDTQGKPYDVYVLRPTGLGLDEKAIEAVNQYKFKPATRDGTPVPVEMNVEVNFQIF